MDRLLNAQPSALAEQPPNDDPPASPDARLLRSVLGRFATGVAIVTCVDDAAGFVGLTVNSFSSVSLQPPLVLWSLRATSPSVAAFIAAPRFAVNVLAEAQVELSRRFASPVDDKFSDGAWALGPHGAPVLGGSAAVLECETVSQQAGGDHWLFIGRVLACAEAPLVPPLVFQGGHYHLLGEIL